MITRAAIVVVLLLAAACSGRAPERAPAAGTTQATDDGSPVQQTPPYTYVAVGASDTVGVGADDPAGQSWPSVFHRHALPGSTTYVNVGVSGSTVRQALAEQLPRALERRAELVTVWLNVNDLFALVPVEEYQRDLTSLVRALRRGGEAQVLVANTPPLDNLPAVRTCLEGGVATSGAPCPRRAPSGGMDLLRFGVAGYNAAIAAVAQREGAVLVDLHSVGLAARADGSEPAMVSADGFHPSAAGHQRVAEAFAQALVSTPATRRFSRT